MPRPPLPGPNSSSPDFFSTLLRESELAAGSETDLAELADTLAARVPDPAISADLALQIVLNELAEQACLTTGATGAAIALERNDELVCRASSGSTAPELGAPLNTKQGLSGECVRTRQVQNCDDIQNDPRTDPAASHHLGARSAMMLPLIRGAEVVGVLEVFSTSPAAFGEQHQRTLELLGQRVLRNLELAATWSPSRSGKADTGGFSNRPDFSEALTDHSGTGDISSDMAIPETANVGLHTGTRLSTYVIGVMVLLTAISLWARIFERLGWLGIEVRSQRAATTSTSTVPLTQTNRATEGQAGGQSLSSPVAATSPNSSADGKYAGPKLAGSSAGARMLPAGSLAVYDRGKEIFRMAPGGQVAGPTTKTSSAVRQAVAIEPEAGAAFESNLLRRVEPEYPEEARRRKIQGPVVLDVRAGSDGSVKDVRLISGHPVLAAAAIAAVNHWQFKPHPVNGRATDIETIITMDFRLPD